MRTGGAGAGAASPPGGGRVRNRAPCLRALVTTELRHTRDGRTVIYSQDQWYNTSMSEISSDYDSPWKEAIERYFEPFVGLFFPEAHADIDWQRPYEFLDTELRQVTHDAELG